MGARENKCQISQNGILHMKFSEFYAPVNSSLRPAPPRTDPRALAIFCLGWQIPGGGDS